MPIRYDCPVGCVLGKVSKSGELSKQAAAATRWASKWDTPDAWRVFRKFALVYLTGGGGRYMDARGRDIALHAGDAILVFPQLAHCYGPRAQDDMWQEIYLVFEGPVFDQWLDAGMLDERQPVCHVEPVGLWRRRMVEVIDSQPPQNELEAMTEVCRLQLLLADMLAAAGSPHGDTHGSWLRQAMGHLDQGLSPQAAARAMHCSYASFRKRFTQGMRVSPSRHQARCTIDKACRLIHQGGLTDKQIADALGFCDEFHFSKRFKQITGLSPRAYRHHLP